MQLSTLRAYYNNKIMKNYSWYHVVLNKFLNELQDSNPGLVTLESIQEHNLVKLVLDFTPRVSTY